MKNPDNSFTLHLSSQGSNSGGSGGCTLQFFLSWDQADGSVLLYLPELPYLWGYPAGVHSGMRVSISSVPHTPSILVLPGATLK